MANKIDYCVMCGKDINHVEHLIRGKFGCICNSCIGYANNA